MAKYIVVQSAQAQQTQEAIGRLYAVALDQPYPIPSTPPIPGCETYYYVDARLSADGTAAAFGPADDFLDTTLGQSIQLGAGAAAITVPSHYQDLDQDWFPPPPPPPAAPPGPPADDE